MFDDQHIKVAVDAVVFGYKDLKLHTLLIKQKYSPFQGWWSLPGGFVKDDESLLAGVARELREEAGITVNYLEQLYTFGDDVKRDPRARVISISYFALVNADQFTLKADTDAIEAQWFEINDLPELAYDHARITEMALTRLRAKIHYQPIGFNLLNKEFTFPELEQLYTAILQKPIDRRNFRKKILSFDLLVETNKFQKEGSGRPAKLYRFHTQKYQALMASGFYFEIKFA